MSITERFTAYPSGSRSRYLFPLDAYRTGARLCRSGRIDLIATQDPFTTGLAGVWLKRRFGIPLQVNNHATFFANRYWLDERRLRHRAFERLGRWVVRQADTLRTVNADQRERYVEMGIDPQRIEVINTPINLGRFLEPPDPAQVTALRAQLDIPAESQVVLWVGRPAARNQKRLGDLLEAFARVRGQLPAAILVIVGDMRGASYVRHHVERLDLGEAVRLPGSVPHAELPAYFALADAFALSSVYEGMPKVAAEAAASGVPVVATRVPGIEDAVLDGETGLLCARENPADMADRLVALLSDPARASGMGERAREYAQERFDRKRTMQAIVGLWERAAAQRGGR